jgi:TIR domain
VDVAEMVNTLDEWVRPVYSNVTSLLVQGPLELCGYQTPLAFIASATCGSLCGDAWWSGPRVKRDNLPLIWHENAPMDFGGFGPFATLRQMGRGFAVLVTGLVSTEDIVTKCRDNAVWIENLAKHLSNCSAKVGESTGFQDFRGVRLFLSHRSTNEQVVKAISKALKKCGIRVWLDKEMMVPSDSIGTLINSGLAESSHFALFWSKECMGPMD